MLVIVTETKKHTITITIDGFSTTYRNVRLDGDKVVTRVGFYKVRAYLNCHYVHFVK